MESSIQLHTIVFVGLHWISSLLLRCYILLGNLLMCFQQFSANISIILKELLIFSSSMLRGFYEDINFLLSINRLMCCKPFSANLSIILKELLGFSPSVFGGFHRVYLVSHG